MTSFPLLYFRQVLRDFRHVNPGSDEEAKELQDTNVRIIYLEDFNVDPRVLNFKFSLPITNYDHRCT